MSPQIQHKSKLPEPRMSHEPSILRDKTERCTRLRSAVILAANQGKNYEADRMQRLNSREDNITFDPNIEWNGDVNIDRCGRINEDVSNSRVEEFQTNGHQHGTSTTISEPVKEGFSSLRLIKPYKLEIDHNDERYKYKSNNGVHRDSKSVVNPGDYDHEKILYRNIKGSGNIERKSVKLQLSRRVVALNTRDDIEVPNKPLYIVNGAKGTTGYDIRRIRSPQEGAIKLLIKRDNKYKIKEKESKTMRKNDIANMTLNKKKSIRHLQTNVGVPYKRRKESIHQREIHYKTAKVDPGNDQLRNVQQNSQSTFEETYKDNNSCLKLNASDKELFNNIKQRGRLSTKFRSNMDMTYLDKKYSDTSYQSRSSSNNSETSLDTDDDDDNDSISTASSTDYTTKVTDKSTKPNRRSAKLDWNKSWQQSLLNKRSQIINPVKIKSKKEFSRDGMNKFPRSVVKDVPCSNSQIMLEALDRPDLHVRLLPDQSEKHSNHKKVDDIKAYSSRGEMISSTIDTLTKQDKYDDNAKQLRLDDIFDSYVDVVNLFDNHIHLYTIFNMYFTYIKNTHVKYIKLNELNTK